MARVRVVAGLNLDADDGQLEFANEKLKINGLGDCAFGDNQERITRFGQS